MRYLYLILILASLSSCSVLHKTTTRTKETVDSVAGKHVDSTVTHEFVDSSEYMYLDSADVTVTLDTATVKVPIDTFKNKDVQILHDVVKAVAGNQKVKSVTIKIHGLDQSQNHIIKTDSIKVIRSDTATVHRTTTQVVKQVNRTSYVIFAIFVFLAIAIFIIIKFKWL
jgi:hypothetical protein